MKSWCPALIFFSSRPKAKVSHLWHPSVYSAQPCIHVAYMCITQFRQNLAFVFYNLHDKVNAMIDEL